MNNRLDDLLEELDSRIKALEQLPYPEVQQQVLAILQLVDQIHRPALQQLSGRLKSAGAWEDCLQDDAVVVIAGLYNLHGDQREEVELALDMVRPYIESHGGSVELAKVEEGTVHVRLLGSCQNCSASSETLKNGVLTALQEGFAGFENLVVEDVEPDNLPLPLVHLQLNRPVFHDVMPLADIPDGEVKLVDVEEHSVLLVRLGDNVFCFQSQCAGCDGPLDECLVSGNILVCTRYNCSFDIRSGRRVDITNGRSLGVIPVTVNNGQISLAVNVTPTAMIQRQKS